MMKRGALGPGQLALLILAVVGFALAAMLVFGVFKNQDLQERELCRLSILSRATVPGILEDGVPLSCSTEKICITTTNSVIDTITGKKYDCKQFAGEKNVRPVKVEINDNPADQQKTLDTIQREVANAMYDCWIMTGQGKMDIFTSTTVDSSVEGKLLAEGVEALDLKVNEIKPRCIVCSRVAFSDELYKQDEKYNILKKIDMNLFLSRERPTPDSLTYWQTFTDQSAGSYASIAPQEGLNKYVGKTSLTQAEVDDIKKILLAEAAKITDAAERSKAESSINAKTADQLLVEINQLSKPLTGTNGANQIAIVFNQIKVSSKAPSDAFWDTFKSGATVGGMAAVSGPGKIASFLIPGPGWFKALVKVGSVGGVAYSLAANAEDVTKSNQALAAATCDKFASNLPGEQYGCSMVKLMAWKVEDINSFCSGGIEGNL